MADPPDRYDRVTRRDAGAVPNSMWHWARVRNPLRVVVQYGVVVLARLLPSLRVKNWLFRRLGMTVQSGAAWAPESTPDVFYPDHITVESGAVVGYDATILCHEFLQSEYRVGEVRIGEGAMVGAGVIVLPGVEIGADAQVAANSLVVDDVPPGETVAGVPAEPVERS